VTLGPRTRWLGREIRFVTTTGSTNDDVLALARAGAPAGIVVMADQQERGRGRQGRAWASPPGANLYLSALVRPETQPGTAPPVTLAAGVAVADAVNETMNEHGARASIKWPNDILLMDRKVAGILTESVTRGGRLEAIVVGIGVNLNWRDLPAELASTATSVALATGTDVDRAAFAGVLLEKLEHWIDLLFAEGTEGSALILSAWKARSATLGRRVTVTDGLTGWARDLDAEGALLVERDDGTVVQVRSGEITHAT
jgi:BirA family biotin operon repressor/biotin-[acetyl-CoA-carboxylase] ligase